MWEGGTNYIIILCRGADNKQYIMQGIEIHSCNNNIKTRLHYFSDQLYFGCIGLCGLHGIALIGLGWIGLDLVE